MSRQTRYRAHAPPAVPVYEPGCTVRLERIALGRTVGEATALRPFYRRTGLVLEVATAGGRRGQIFVRFTTAPDTFTRLWIRKTEVTLISPPPVQGA